MGTITAAFCLISSLLYVKKLAEAVGAGAYRFNGISLIGKTDSSILFYGLSFFIVTFLCNLFVFLLIIALQGLLMFLLRGAWLARVSLWVQVVLLMGLASVFIWLPRLYDADPTLQSVSSGFSYLFPPLWFHGLHQWLNGAVGGLGWYYSFVSWFALVVLVGVYGVSLPFSLKQFFKTKPWPISTVHPDIGGTLPMAQNSV